LTELFFAPPYALLILSGGLAAARLAVLPASFSKRCSQIGLLCVIASYLTLVGSRWVELNKGSMRYLDIVFFCFVLTLLLAVSAELNRKWKIVQYALLVGSVALHLASLMPYVHSSPSARDTLRPLLTSSCTAFIGDYWTTYLVAGMFPDRFLATPHEGSYVRSARMRDAVLAQKEICLIKKEGWSNGLFHRRVEPATAGTYTVSDAPAGFEPYGGASGALAFTPGRTYRARVDNGQHSEERWFTTATCQESGAPAITSIVSRCEDMIPQATIHFSGPPDDRGGFFVDIDQEAIDPKTEWLEKFPEEITQFGVVLKKIDSPQRYGKFSICRYAQ
jgi:predicted membrane channel-forming protein YqfA (hemolysin III family)